MTNLDNEIRKPKTHKGRKYLENRSAKLIENDKNTLFIKGGSTSETVTKVLANFNTMKKPFCSQLKYKNSVVPFEDLTFVEKMCKKYDSSLFLLGSHSKKRPNNLVFGRLFNHELLDMFETGIVNFKSMQDFHNPKVPCGTKPCLIFSGEAFEDDEVMKAFKNILIDMFRGPKVENLQVKGVQLILHFVIISENGVEHPVVNLRAYSVDENTLEHSSVGVKLSNFQVESLTEIGPRMDLVMRRHVLANDDKWKRATRIPQEIKQKNKVKKNMSTDVFGSKLGRVHVGRQDIDTVQISKPRALKRVGKEIKETEDTNSVTKMKKTKNMDHMETD